jgi:hypothetical protein
MDGVQIGLDVIGLVPIFGEVADGLNGVISLARGDYAGAALSFAAMIPGAGMLATVGKIGMAMAPLVTKAKSVRKYWPPNNGALGKWETKYLMPGEELDRFGSDFGYYFSPRNTPMSMRSLPGGNTGVYNAYRVVKPFPVQSSTIAPAFGKLGYETQYLSPVKAKTLLERGIIIPIK